ncbi:hypothetical protein LUZ60_015990 [Juncus effusus]|nr:hypothetical protein LUZ60_015990 [Juncus effusus]
MGGASGDSKTGTSDTGAVGVMEGLKPVLGMVMVQMAFAGLNIFYKLAINDGMDMKVLIAYRYLFATCFLLPLAFFFERKSWSKITWKVVMLSFLCGLLGGALAQNLYITSLKLTSATFASAMTNLIPAMTFILAVLFRLESLKIRTVSGQAKVTGTLLGVGGAMLLTFYKGVPIKLWKFNIDLASHHDGSSADVAQQATNQTLGSLLAVSSCLCYAVWLIIQAKVTVQFPHPTSSTAMMCTMATIQSFVFALITQRDWMQWKLGFDIRLLTVFYSGVVASGLVLTVMTWCIKKKGPLFASVFNPLMLVIVAVLSSLLFNEILHLGSVLGAILIVIGLYMVLWGKGKEAVKLSESEVEQRPDNAHIIHVVIDSSHHNAQATVLDLNPKVAPII